MMSPRPSEPTPSPEPTPGIEHDAIRAPRSTATVADAEYRKTVTGPNTLADTEQRVLWDWYFDSWGSRLVILEALDSGNEEHPTLVYFGADGTTQIHLEIVNDFTDENDVNCSECVINIRDAAIATAVGYDGTEGSGEVTVAFKMEETTLTVTAYLQGSDYAITTVDDIKALPKAAKGDFYLYPKGTGALMSVPLEVAQSSQPYVPGLIGVRLVVTGDEDIELDAGTDYSVWPTDLYQARYYLELTAAGMSKITGGTLQVRYVKYYATEWGE